MNSAKLVELRALAIAATPGEWSWDGPVWDYNYDEEAPWLVAKSVADPVLRGEIKCDRKADADFIAACNPATILSLIARIEELEANVKALSPSTSTEERV
jgi:hypothetical protein